MLLKSHENLKIMIVDTSSVGETVTVWTKHINLVQVPGGPRLGLNRAVTVTRDRDRDCQWALPVAAGSRAGPCSAGHWHGLNLGSLKAQARAGGGLSARHRFW